MAFNPNLPANGAEILSAELRSQFNGLKAIIDALVAGTVTAVVVDAVNTIGPGLPASVDATVIGNTLHLTFSIPQGNDGAQGPQGTQGDPGPQGPPFGNALVDAVTTLNPGSDATVSVTFDGSNVRFTFGIPRGATGADGATGPQGAQGNDGPPGNDGTQGPTGPTGPQGAPGEVSAQQLTDGLAATLASATANSSANTNAIPTLDTPFADPDAEALRTGLNALISGLRR